MLSPLLGYHLSCHFPGYMGLGYFHSLKSPGLLFFYPQNLHLSNYFLFQFVFFDFQSFEFSDFSTSPDFLTSLEFSTSHDSPPTSLEFCSFSDDFISSQDPFAFSIDFLMFSESTVISYFTWILLLFSS